MTTADTLDDFDRFLSNESQVEKYVSLGLVFEETLERLRNKGSDAERQALERVLEMPQARANLIELGARKILDEHRQTLEEAFSENPRKWGEPLNRVFKQNLDNLERVVTSKITELAGFAEASSAHGRARKTWTRPVAATIAVAILFGLLAFILHRVGFLDPAMMKLAAR
jgi:hypothetical protein